MWVFVVVYKLVIENMEVVYTWWKLDGLKDSNTLIVCCTPQTLHNSSTPLAMCLT